MKVTVGELIHILNDYPQDAVLMVQSDAEGNQINYFSDVYDGIYVADAEHVYLAELTYDLEILGYSDEDVYEGDDGEYVVVLCPV